MYAGMRRVPAERARHTKRLGHVQAGQGNAFPVLASPDLINSSSESTTVVQSPTPTSSQTPSTPATSATHSTSSAPTSSLTTSSSSSLPSSATTPSSSSVTSSTDAPTLSSSVGIPSPSLTSSTPTSSSVSSPQTRTGGATNSGLSGGAIAGIIAGAAIVGTALIVFFIRKTYLRRRERKHVSWTGAPGLGAGTLDEPKPFPDASERNTSLTSGASTPQRNVPPSPFPPYGQSMYSTPVSPLPQMQPPAMPPYPVPTPPPVTYNNPTPVAAYSTHPVSSAYGPGNLSSQAMANVVPVLSTLRAQHAPMEATVKCTFVPTLPDELSITTGEHVFIVERYDDGWDLCMNARGERGMVPRECLEQVSTDQLDVGWRNVGRASSLNPDGQRY